MRKRHRWFEAAHLPGTRRKPTVRELHRVSQLYGSERCAHRQRGLAGGGVQDARWFGTALAKGAEGGKLPASIATTNTEIGQGLPLCVIVIRGAFQPEKGRMKAVPLPDHAGTKPFTVTAVGGTMRRIEPPPAA